MTVFQGLQALAIGFCFGSMVGNMMLDNYAMALVWFGLLVVNIVARGLNA